MILGLEEGDFGSKNETREGMEGGIVEKRADGLGTFLTISIYVKYPPCPDCRFSPFSAVFLSLSSRLAAVLLILSILLVIVFGGACLAMPLCFHIFPIIHIVSIIF